VVADYLSLKIKEEKNDWSSYLQSTVVWLVLPSLYHDVGLLRCNAVIGIDLSKEWRRAALIFQVQPAILYNL